MRFLLEVTMDNAAFDDEYELVRILNTAAEKIVDGHEMFKLYDINGNGVGRGRIIH